MVRDAVTGGSRSAIAVAGLGAVLFSAKAIVVKLCYRHGADTETVLALRMLFSAIALGKRIELRQWLAMGVAYAGVSLVFMQDVRLDGERAVLDSGLVFIAAVCYSVYLIFAGEIVRRVGSIRLVAYASASATFFCVTQALLHDPNALLTQTAEVYRLSLLNGTLCTFVPMLLIMAAVNRVGALPAPVAAVSRFFWLKHPCRRGLSRRTRRDRASGPGCASSPASHGRG